MSLNPYWKDAQYEEVTFDPDNGFVRWKEISKQTTGEYVIYTLNGSNGKERELKLPLQFTS